MTKPSRIKKLMESDDETPYEPTPRACRYWFEVLNRELFSGKLTPVDGIDIRRRQKVYAQYECTWYDDGSMQSLLAMSRKYQSKKFFVNILFHEMIHHYQALYGEPLGHGPSFKRWVKKARKFGLELNVKYD